MGVKFMFVLSLVLFQAGYYKRWKWAPIKSRKLVIDAVN
jgi:ubiquinol-cytochrome c reductase cytochrome c1 subunit